MTLATAPAEPLVPIEGTTQQADGTTLRTLHWPAVGDPWAVALVVHGLGEHAGRYETVAAALTSAGIEVFGYDHRGFGGSSGYRAYVDRWSQIHDDLATQVEAARAERPGLPLVMYAHSLGGLIGTGYVVAGQGRPLPDLLVLSAPAVDSSMVPTWKKKLGAALTGITPRMRIPNGLAQDGLSRDPEVRIKADADPLCLNSSTIRFGAEVFAEQDRLKVLLPGLTSMPVPTYVVHGDADPIVPLRVSDVLANKSNVTRRVWPGLRHECHHEPEQAEVLAEVVAWIRSQVPGAATAG
jgi:acylglycerol lipase